MPDLIATEQPLTDEEFSAFQGLFPRSLPVSFKMHYMAHNGGAPFEGDVEAGKWGLPLHGFNPIKYGGLTIEELIDELGRIDTDKFGAWERYEYVPFGYDAFQNTIFLSLRDSDYDTVYLCDGCNIINVAASFAELIDKLYKPSIDPRW